MKRFIISAILTLLLLTATVASLLMRLPVFAQTSTPTSTPTPGANINQPVSLPGGIILPATQILTAYQFVDSANDAYYLDPSAETSLVVAGNVGIGMTEPLGKLHIFGASPVLVRLQANTNNSGNYTGVLFKTSSDTNDSYFKGGIFYKSNSHGWGIGDLMLGSEITSTTTNVTPSNIQGITILGINGNVGIGTTAPGGLLTLAKAWSNPVGSGTTNNEHFRIMDNGGNVPVLDIGLMSTSPYGAWLQSRASSDFSTTYPIILQPTAGNVGIGTTAPTVQFERACPAGFTNVKAGNNQLGCMETAHHGAADYHSATNTCFTTYGGRLPTLNEWYITMNNYVLTHETGEYEWVADGGSYNVGVNGLQYPFVTGRDNLTYAVYSSATTSYDYRCWIPR
jgi:hypothetical protein